MRIIINNSKVGKLKPGVTLASFRAKYPNHQIDRVTHFPTTKQLENMVFDGTCFTPDGCIVEPDGSCEHGLKSWLLIYGLI